MKILNIIFLLFFLHPVNILADGRLGWMDDIYYFPYPKYESYLFYIDISKGYTTDNFGDFYMVDEEQGLIYHPRTASNWYVYGESADSLFLYGPNWECWIWTGRHIFPWMYVITNNNRTLLQPGWAYFKHVEMRPSGEIWAIMEFQSTGWSKGRVIIPF